MSSTTPLDTRSPEKYLTLPDDRTLAYAASGNPSSSIIVIFFHGVFGVGIADTPQQVLLDKDVHYIAPTLAGWGKSSPRSKGTPYHVALASDTSALIDHLHPNKDHLEIYVSGGSYGTVPAQMLYGASFDIFPYGRYVKGCMLLAPFSPFREDKDYAKTMTMANYIMVGPPAQYIPFKIVPRLVSATIGSKFKTVEGAEAFVRSSIFDKMDDEEKATFAKWRADRGKAEGQLEREFGENIHKSVHDTWDGFTEVSDVIHGDWGYSPAALDDEHNKRPIFIVAAKGDKLAPFEMAQWLTKAYKNAHLRPLTGGHLAGIYWLDDLWKEFLALC